MSTFKLEVSQNSGTQYFKKNELVFQKEFAEKSIASFREAGAIFSTDSESNLDIDTHSKQQLFETKMEELQNVFQGLCIRDNLAINHYNKNLQKRVFNTYKDHFENEKYLRSMSEYCETWNRRKTAQKVLKSWQEETMSENRITLKNGCLKKTDLEIQKMQREYESMISNLENILSTKLLQLKKEEEEHRQLAEKYDTMVEKRAPQQQEQD